MEEIMANGDNAPFKSYNLKGYTISNSEGNWRAVNPKTGVVVYASTSLREVEDSVEANPLNSRKKK